MFYALSEAFRRLNLDPHRSPSINIVPINGDEQIIMEAEHMDICITTNEVRYVFKIHNCISQKSPAGDWVYLLPFSAETILYGIWL